MTSSAGRKVRLASSAHTMPMAATGPVDLLEFSSENSRHSRPTVTVAAEATRGSSTPRQATFIASKWLS